MSKTLTELVSRGLTGAAPSVRYLTVKTNITTAVSINKNFVVESNNTTPHEEKE